MKQRFEEGDSKCFQSKVLDRSRSAPSRGIENVLYYQEFLLFILCYWIIHVQHWLKIIIYLPKKQKKWGSDMASIFFSFSGQEGNYICSCKAYENQIVDENVQATLFQYICKYTSFKTCNLFGMQICNFQLGV